jgi:glutaredoxin
LAPRNHHVVMYSRRTCGLCDKARAVIQSEQNRTALRFEEVYIDGNEALEGAYGLRVPVVMIDGVEEFEYEVEPSRLRQLLAS